MNKNSRSWGHWAQRTIAWSLVAYFAVLAAGSHIWGPDAGPMPIVQAPLLVLAAIFDGIAYAGLICLALLICFLVFCVYFGLCRLLGNLLAGPPRRR